MSASAPRSVRAWLSTIFGLIVLMTAVGGITRLTGSGLSMVEWRPLMGAVPPLDEAAWHVVFDEYKATPQYQLVNHWMTLSDFKRIFFWEYLHRLLGRGIGLVVFLPWVYFLVRKALSPALARRVFGLFLLGGLQGALGWIMVMSGLVDAPRVSHLRLAAHLLLAFLLAQAVLWVRLSLDPTPGGARRLSPGSRLGLGLLALAVLVQTAWGAFMAGTRAGWFASTFPDVNGAWSPATLAGEEPLWRAVFMEPGPIHATHRLLAWMLIPLVLLVAGVLWREGAPQVRRPVAALVGLLGLQITLGAATVMMQVPTAVATAHQVTGLLLLSAVTWTAERGRRGA